MGPIFNVSYRKVGGLRFVRIGRFGFSFWVSRTHRGPRVYEGGSTVVVCRDREWWGDA